MNEQGKRVGAPVAKAPDALAVERQKLTDELQRIIYETNVALACHAAGQAIDQRLAAHRRARTSAITARLREICGHKTAIKRGA